MFQLKFLADSRVEWIYRGSTRLGPLFTEMEQQKLRRLQNDEAEKAGAGHVHRRQTAPVRRRNAPYIEYRRDAQEQETGQGAGQEEGGIIDKGDKDQVKRPVARKSTTTVRRPEQSATTKWENEGQTFKTEIDPPPRIKFRQHNCSTKYGIKFSGNLILFSIVKLFGRPEISIQGKELLSLCRHQKSK